MKQLLRIVFAGMVLVAGVGCSKNKDSYSKIDKEIANTIQCTWELRQIVGGMPAIDYAAGNGNQLKFTATGYEKNVDGKLVKSGTYALVADSTCQESVGWLIAAGEFTQRIVYDNDNSAKQFAQIKNGELILLAGYFPLDSGVEMTYVKVQK